MPPSDVSAHFDDIWNGAKDDNACAHKSSQRLQAKFTVRTVPVLPQLSTHIGMKEQNTNCDGAERLRAPRARIKKTYPSNSSVREWPESVQFSLKESKDFTLVLVRRISICSISCSCLVEQRTVSITTYYEAR